MSDQTPDTSEAGETGGGAPAPQENLTPKERRQRRRARARSRQGAGAPMTLEERIAARAAERRRKAEQRRRRRAKERAARAETRAAEPAREADHAPEHGPGRPKTRQGVVTSAKPDKTIIVRIDVVQRHRRYRKILRSTVKLQAHDERNEAREGDTVRVRECRPMSATKRWRLLDVVERAR
jgi:small subunit ribosomal protein S17